MRLARYIERQTRLIVAAGGVRDDGIYPFVLHTRGGTLRLKPLGDWVACRFDDIELAKRAGVPLKPLNRKCNFHDTTTTNGASAFEDFIAVVRSDT